jgi:hypothetical protein
LHISKNGHVAGPGFLWSELAGFVAFDLGVPGQIRSFKVNSFGEVVGSAWTPAYSGTHGFFHDGAIHDLNDIADLPADVTIREAQDINEYGQIAAIAAKGDRTYAVRLTGVPSIAVAQSVGSIVRLAIRPASETPLRLESSTDLHFWTAVQTWNQPAPIEFVHLDIEAAKSFFRVAR